MQNIIEYPIKPTILHISKCIIEFCENFIKFVKKKKLFFCYNRIKLVKSLYVYISRRYRGKLIVGGTFKDS